MAMPVGRITTGGGSLPNRVFGMSRNELNWHDEAACAGVENPEIFFVGDSGPRPACFRDIYETRAAAREAKAICEGCPVKEICLESALARHEYYGIWGGTTWTDRQKLLVTRAHEAQAPHPGPRRPYKTLCKRGHVRAGNIDSGGSCISCKRDRQREWQAQNPRKKVSA